jgi:hypothetical protein
MSELRRRKIEELNYEVYSNEKLIAVFLHKDDAEGCADYLQEKYEDCQFKVIRRIK